MARKKKASKKARKKGAAWKSPATRKRDHKLAGRIEKQIGKAVKGDKARKLRVFHGIAYGKITGRKPVGGQRGLAKKKGGKRKKKKNGRGRNIA